MRAQSSRTRWGDPIARAALFVYAPSRGSHDPNPPLPLDAGTVTPYAIASTETFGTATIALTIAPTGIPSAEAVPGPVVNQVYLVPTGIPSAEAFGTPQLVPTVAPAGIASGEAFGTPAISQQSQVGIIVLFDPAHYPVGTRWFFEMNLMTSSGAVPTVGQLYNKTDAGLVTGTAVSVSATTKTRARSGQFTPSSGAKEYIGVAGGASGATHTWFSSRIIGVYP